MTINKFVESEPYPWPFDGILARDNIALIIFNMHPYFCAIGG